MKVKDQPHMSISFAQKMLDDRKENLSHMKTARQHIADIINEEHIQDDEISKKLDRLDSKIKEVEKMINDYQSYIDSINNTN